MTSSGVTALATEIPDSCYHSDRVKAMLEQSDSMYMCSDYIGRRSTKERTPCHRPTDEIPSSPEVSMEHDKVDTVCREKMCEWSYRVCDHFQTGREIVAVSFSYLDRFVDKCSCDRNAFKLAAMTTLYMANKIYGGPHTLSIGALAELSRGEFEKSHITDMEVIILETLAWRLHPPTTQYFIESFFNYISIPSNGSMSTAIHQRAIFFAELALYDYAFACRERSLIAIASIMNAMEGLDSITVEQQQRFLESVNVTFKLNYTTEMVETVRNRLWYVYSMSAQYREDDAMVCGATSTVVKKKRYEKATFMGGESSSARSTSPVSVATTSGPYNR